ncbi:MAG: serine/threonine protein kinase, partial [Gammaproteobacteria bacterium]|nr:serine/threonine protein kinase [Gammaproteobacteria bacterium]
MLSHYRLVEKIGEGGMGVVWKAVDTNLGREVAIKVLPPGFTADADRLARFEREAKLLASLNHPHIASVFGFYSEGDTRYISLELIAGEDLSEQMLRGAIEPRRAARLALQIAEALETAHENGVIHRDLKPANIKFTQPADGTTSGSVAATGIESVKVLDFGLAKAFETDPASGSGPGLTHSPTLTSAGTRAGVILGTAGYMSPEQARGKAVDRRADIWAFGCVVFEMLAGSCGFPGETISDKLVSVLNREPAWSELPPATPARIRRMLERCLDKDAQRRLRDVGEARIALEDPLAGDEPEEQGAAARSPRVFVAAAVAGIALFAAGYLLRLSEGSGINPDARVRRLTFSPGLEQEPNLSPDG